MTLGVLKAPVDCFWSFSNISCSSLGREGGAGPRLNIGLSARRVGVVVYDRVAINGAKARRDADRKDMAVSGTVLNMQVGMQAKQLVFKTVSVTQVNSK